MGIAEDADEGRAESAQRLNERQKLGGGSALRDQNGRVARLADAEVAVGGFRSVAASLRAI